MELLTKEQARQIVEKMMHIVPYNINIMDSAGTILASGDPERVGQVHAVALEAIRENRAVVVREEWGDMRPGINTPIYFQERPVGVIGISGDVDQVSGIVRLVRATAELLINQEYLLNSRQVNKRVKEQFLYEWAYKVTEYSPDFISRGEALGIDVTLPRRAVTVYVPEQADCMRRLEELREFLEPQDCYIRLKEGQFAVFLTDTAKLQKKAKAIAAFAGVSAMGFGAASENMNRSLLEAREAVKLGRILRPEQTVFRYEDAAFFAAMLSEKPAGAAAAAAAALLAPEEGSAALLETLTAYIRHSGEINAVARELHLHRNSLHYRLDKIAELTGKNPRDYTDLFYLYCSYVAWESGRAGAQ